MFQAKTTRGQTASGGAGQDLWTQHANAIVGMEGMGRAGDPTCSKLSTCGERVHVFVEKKSLRPGCFLVLFIPRLLHVIIGRLLSGEGRAVLEKKKSAVLRHDKYRRAGFTGQFKPRAISY